MHWTLLGFLDFIQYRFCKAPKQTEYEALFGCSNEKTREKLIIHCSDNQYNGTVVLGGHFFQAKFEGVETAKELYSSVLIQDGWSPMSADQLRQLLPSLQSNHI